MATLNWNYILVIFKSTIDDLTILFLKLKSNFFYSFLLLLLVLLITCLFEMITLAAIVPLLALLTDKSLLDNIPIVKYLLESFSQILSLPILHVLIISFLFLVILAVFLRVFLLYLNSNLTVKIGNWLSMKVFSIYINQNYLFHTNSNTSETISTIRDKVEIVVFAIILPIFTLITNLVLALMIILMIFVISWKISLVLILVLTPTYIVIMKIYKNKLLKNSLAINSNQTNTVKIIQETLGEIRELIMNNNQSFYINKFYKPDYTLRKSLASNLLIAGIPRILVEGVGIILISLIAFYLSTTEQGLIFYIPVLGALAVGAQRILPSIQQAYAAWVTIIGNRSSLDAIIQTLNLERKIVDKNTKKMKFNKQINFENVSFQYNDKNEVIRNLNFEIKKGEIFGLVGKTGEGKSTTIDLICGLIYPKKGEVKVDGKKINFKNAVNWQKNISLVPQQIYLSDLSLIENICPGIQLKDINYKKINEVLKLCDLDIFVNKLSEGLFTNIGERGIRLSGGQRQRIGIARALYRENPILIFDEATNALDEETEKKIIKNIITYKINFTFIIISHRKSTLKFCNQILDLKKL